MEEKGQKKGIYSKNANWIAKQMRSSAPKAWSPEQQEDKLVYIKTNSKQSDSFSNSNQLPMFTYECPVTSRPTNKVIPYRQLEDKLLKEKKSPPLPLGVITCTRSSTVTLFLPFFFINALQ